MFLYTSALEAVAWLEALDGDAWCRYFEAVHDAAVARRDDGTADGPAP